MERLKALEPVGRAGRSIFIYRADFGWPPPVAPEPVGAQVTQ
jgi:hypothetical protein